MTGFQIVVRSASTDADDEQRDLTPEEIGGIREVYGCTEQDIRDEMKRQYVAAAIVQSEGAAIAAANADAPDEFGYAHGTDFDGGKW